jgi:hypothetical protein
MKDRATRHLELTRRGITDHARREAILRAEDEARRRHEQSVFDLLKENEAMRAKLSEGKGAFKLYELSLIAEVK